MPSITKPLIPLAPLPKNDLGLTIRDYEGAMSTLCAGCGHDSVTAPHHATHAAVLLGAVKPGHKTRTPKGGGVHREEEVYTERRRDTLGGGGGKGWGRSPRKKVKGRRGSVGWGGWGGLG